MCMVAFLLQFSLLRNGLSSLNIAMKASKMMYMMEVAKVHLQLKSSKKYTILILDDWCTKMHEIVNTVGISNECVCCIWPDNVLCKINSVHAHDGSKMPLCGTFPTVPSTFYKNKLIFCINIYNGKICVLHYTPE